MLKILTKEEFERRTADGARTPVFREYLADRETPVSVLTRVADAPGDVFLLESVYNGERKGRYSLRVDIRLRAARPAPPRGGHSAVRVRRGRVVPRVRLREEHGDDREGRVRG